MQAYKYLLKKTSKKSRIKALVLGLAVSVLTFASVLSKCRANIAIGSKGDTELGRMFVASFSNLQYCELGLFPVFSAIFLLLLTDCGFEREMFVLKQPEKIGRLTRSKVFFSLFHADFWRHFGPVGFCNLFLAADIRCKKQSSFAWQEI